MKRSELKELIREELHAILNERSLAEAEFTSAGSVPRKHGRKMSQAQISKRDTLGRKILSALDKGKNTNNSLRKAFKKWAAKNDHPISSEKTMKSYAWAMASDWAIRGKDFPPVREGVNEQKEEAVSELKRSTVGSYLKKAVKNMPKYVDASRDDGHTPYNDKKWNRARVRLRARSKGVNTAIDQLSRDGEDPRKKMKVKNPKTGEEILALSAYHAGPLHPAYAIAKAALKRKK